MLLQFIRCLAICLSVVGCCFAQSETAASKSYADSSHRERQNLIGSVKTIIWKEATVRLLANLETIDEVKAWKHLKTETFEPSGKLISSCLYNHCKFYEVETIKSEERIENQVILKHDKSGKLNEKILLKRNGFVTERRFFDYGQTGKLTKVTVRNENDEVKEIETYSDNEQLIERKSFSSGLVNDIDTYDDQGHLIGQIIDRRHPNDTIRWFCKYDKSGNGELLLYLGEDIFPSSKTISSYKFDRQGNWTQ